MAVKNAPMRTSFQPISTSGKNLKMIPNRAEIIIKVSPKLNTLMTKTVRSGKYWVNLSLRARINPFIINDAINRNPRLMIIEKDNTRLMSIFFQPFLGFAFTCQIWLIESCISIKTPVAPINKVMIPKTTANVESF